jgi:hypothetical protein
MKIRVKFEPRDLWVGIFWRREVREDYFRPANGAFGIQQRPDGFSVFVCVVPCFPIVLRFGGASA